jgi:hypothetical protein
MGIESDFRMDTATRAALRDYVTRVGWHPAARNLGVSCGMIRRGLTGARVRRSSVVAVRLALATAQIGGQP